MPRSSLITGLFISRFLRAIAPKYFSTVSKKLTMSLRKICLARSHYKIGDRLIQLILDGHRQHLSDFSKTLMRSLKVNGHSLNLQMFRGFSPMNKQLVIISATLFATERQKFEKFFNSLSTANPTHRDWQQRDPICSQINTKQHRLINS